MIIIRDNFSKICIYTFVVIFHLTCLDEASQMGGRNIKNTLYCQQVFPIIKTSDKVNGHTFRGCYSAIFTVVSLSFKVNF